MDGDELFEQAKPQTNMSHVAVKDWANINREFCRTTLDAKKKEAMAHNIFSENKSSVQGKPLSITPDGSPKNKKFADPFEAQNKRNTSNLSPSFNGSHTDMAADTQESR